VDSAQLISERDANFSGEVTLGLTTQQFTYSRRRVGLLAGYKVKKERGGS